MGRVRGVSMNKAPNIIKYPKIIYVKCLETGKVYKSEKMCRNMSIVKSEHIYFNLNFFGRCFEIYDKKLYKNTKFKIGCAGNIITFYLSDDMCIEFDFTILGTYYIRFYKYNNLNILQFDKTDILNLLIDGFEDFSCIDDIISDIRKFNDEQYFIYSKPILNSLKTAFMKTY